MTEPPAPNATNALAETIRPAAPNVGPNAAVQTVEQIEARTVAPIGAKTEELIGVRRAAPIARDSAVVVRCWRRKSPDFLSPRFRRA